MKNIIIFTGAGLSNILKLPMVTEFQELIKKSSVYQLDNILSKNLGENITDIECVMYALEEFISNKSTSITKTLVENPELFIGKLDPVLNKSQILNISQRIGNYLTEIKSGIYKLLNSFDINDAATLYLNIIREVKLQYPESKITFFTANYDLTFEKSVRSMKNDLNKLGIENIYYGFSDQFSSMAFDIQTQEKENSTIDYYKIHGSLDWHFDNDLICTKSGTNANPADPNNMPILYPGFKGRPTTQPFIQLHNLFFEKCKSADAFISIGFAFRDPHINDLLNQINHINKNLILHYFNPVAIENMPKESGVHELSKTYGKRFVYHERKVINNERPFGPDWTT
jgi:hypothetical protein